MGALSPPQSQGMKILLYLDDWLICAPSWLRVTQDTALLLTHVAQLGLKVNLEKNSLMPEHYLHWCDTRYSRYEGLPVAPVAARHPPPPFPLLRGQSAALQSLSLPLGQVDSRVNPLPPLVLSDGGNLPSVTWDLVRREKIPQD